MLTKNRGREVNAASYLSPKERRKAMLLTKAIRSSKNVEELLNYQIQLEELIEKAEANKALIREHARVLKGQDVAIVKAHLRSKVHKAPVETDTKKAGLMHTKN